MTKIAVIKTGAKQYKVKEGDSLRVEKLEAAIGSKVKLETLLIAESDGTSVNLGKPSLGESVTAEVLEHAKADKVSVIKFKNKVHYKKNVGHRQHYTKLKITTIA
jgi:large subunit ribosomal protein L21